MKKFAFNVLSSATLLATAAVPVVATVAPIAVSASSASTATALTVPTIKDGQSNPLGTVKLTIPAGTIHAGDQVVFKLPSGYTPSAVDLQVQKSVTDSTYKNVVVVPQYRSGTDANGLQASDFDSLTKIGSREYSLKVKDNQNVSAALANDTVVYIYLNDVAVDEGKSGAVNLNLAAPSSSGFPTGDVTVGTTSSTGSLTVVAGDTYTKNDNFTTDFRITEDVLGSFTSTDNKELKIKLPSGYVWGSQSAIDAAGVKTIYGDSTVASHIKVTRDSDNTLVVTYDSSTASKSATQIWLDNIPFSADTDVTQKDGDINATIYGDYTTNVSSVVVGSYGEFGSSVNAEDATSVTAGNDDQKISRIHIKESLPESLVKGRTITLTLPEGVAWQNVFEDQDSKGSQTGFTGTWTGPDANDLSLHWEGYTGSDHRTAKWTVLTPSTDVSDLYLKDAKIAVKSSFNGDVNVEVGGTAGLTGTLKVATAQAPFSIKASTVPNIAIGAAGQAAGDLEITENAAGSFKTDNGTKDVTVTLPSGIEFDGTPTVEVTNGDLRIEDVKVNDNNDTLTFNVKTESSVASTLKVSGIKLKAYRSVPEGNVVAKVNGGALSSTNLKINHGDTDWTTNNDIAKVALASVATPAAQGDAKVAFTIGQTTYTVNGQQQTLDVAPYTEAGRTYLPIRFVASALGVSDDNIVWNDATKTVTLIKGDRIAQFTVGQSSYVVNGIRVSMDAAAQFKQNRNMIPLRYAAQALGVTVNWDDATQTVTLN